MVNFFPINQIQSWFNNWQWRRGAQNFFVNQVFNASTPVYVDVEKSMIAYMDCPHLNVVVNKGAELFSNGRWIMVDTQDESITYPDDPILTLLNNPNPIQNSQNGCTNIIFTGHYIPIISFTNYKAPPHHQLNVCGTCHQIG